MTGALKNDNGALANQQQSFKKRYQGFDKIE